MGSPAAVQARHLSGASIGKLIEWEVGRDFTTGAHKWSPAAILTHVWHAENNVEIAIKYDRVEEYADTYDQIGLGPDSWVRVMQVAS